MLLNSLGAKLRLSYVFLPVLALCVTLAAQTNNQTTTHPGRAAHAGLSGCNIDPVALSSGGELLIELRKLRAELLGFYVVAKQEKTSELELKVNELQGQRERMDAEERRAIQHLAELNAQLASSTPEDRERIEEEKAARTGPALEALRARQTSLRRREDDLRGLLASEQQRLSQLRQLVAEANAAR
jgi:hypothetical protein